MTNLAQSGETDNPYFSISRNKIDSRTIRFFPNLGLTVTPFSWGYLKTNIGVDNYTNSNILVRHPESAVGFSNNGILDNAVDVTRNINTQTLFNINRQNLTKNFTLSGLVGHSLSDSKSTVNAESGRNWLDPNFVSINNTDVATRFARTSIAQRRLVSVFGQAQLGYKDLLFLTATGRNDWTSTIPVERNSFFYPAIQGSFILSDAVPSIGRHMTLKLRSSYAQVGRDARPYAYRPVLESKTTTGGGYGYGFTGPNLGLKPEFAESRENGFEMSMFDDRLGLDATYYAKETTDQIVNDIRGSYGTGFILFNLNGAKTRNTGYEVVARAMPVRTANASWEVIANYEQAKGRVVALPNALPESYVSDTWLYGNIRNGVAPQAVHALHDGHVLSEERCRAADHRPHHRLAGAKHELRRCRLRSSAAVDDGRNEQLQVQEGHGVDAVGLPPRRRCLQRHAALPHDARSHHADARPRNAAHHSGRAA
ncbi:TonB-dependent receptor domain-containing protein [Gemmatimonas sp.]|uniref:TonB-dependent receptor domain-containing protein n=1 Tax=Gemmatimonas sp. TaxID=1962908 RepID=UPI003DA32EC2